MHVPHQRRCGCGKPQSSIPSEQSSTASSVILACCCEVWQVFRRKSASPSWLTTSSASSKCSAQSASLRHSYPPDLKSLLHQSRSDSHLTSPPLCLRQPHLKLCSVTDSQERPSCSVAKPPGKPYQSKFHEASPWRVPSTTCAPTPSNWALASLKPTPHFRARRTLSTRE